MIKSAILFVLAGLAEIGGGYLVWLWLREQKGLWLGIIGAMVLVFYGVIPTLQEYPHFGRVYAAYGGIFIVLSLLWGWFIDKKRPDKYDWIGSCVALAGAAIIIWTPR
ncbi:YnfA family protein [Desulfoscipio geothermicus]|uniref:Small multidrug resistance family-3 protein n=1 Tax=Desulfoscipio geothermicus DSM 3669 TaxID=1121426 RepID=A0A1I6E0H0_9FIRM|nr:YnfA family protein [Desulfoscipio geothermicus]SFR11175.1 small multidrug resistance family-3 protein [Desulfoscipio geothermicus DSM 3669]